MIFFIFLSVTKRKFKIIGVTHISFLLDSLSQGSMLPGIDESLQIIKEEFSL